MIAEGGTAAFALSVEPVSCFPNVGWRGCIVCAVDSLINKESLRYLERCERLKTEDNPDGIIPGEAAACLYLSPVNQANQGDSVVIRGLGYAYEEVTVMSDQAILGLGLAEAIKASADANLSMETIGFRISNVSGERYGFIEANYALARVLRIRKEEFDFLHCSDCIGEVAGAGCLHVGLYYFSFSFDKGIALHSGVLCETGSDIGNRAAAIVTGRIKGSYNGQ